MSEIKDKNYLPPSPQFWELPPSPQFWGNKKIKVFQSPPELGDLGGLDQLKRRQIDAYSVAKYYKTRAMRKSQNPVKSTINRPLTPNSGGTRARNYSKSPRIGGFRGLRSIATQIN
jgi:hypothetical protein